MKNPIYSKPLNSSGAEADANLVAKVWRERGMLAANASLDMIFWLTDAAIWEMVVIADRARYIAFTEGA